MAQQQTHSKNKRTIKQNILISFIVCSIISVIIVGIISLAFMGMVGSTTTGESTSALKDQIKRNIATTAGQNALIIEQKLANAEAMVDAMAEQAKLLFGGSYTYGDRQSYYDYFFEYTYNGVSELGNPDPANTPTDVSFNTEYKKFVSWSHASYYFPASSRDNYENRNLDLNNTIATSAKMDHIFQYVHQHAPEFRWLYMAFDSNGLFINYPGSEVGGTHAERTTDSWDPRNDGWYRDIMLGIKFSEPYPDPIDGEPLITIGSRVNVGGKTFIVAGDISIKDLKEKIVDIEILDTGYGSMITSSGTVVAHKEYTPSSEVEEFATIGQVEINYPSGQALTEAQISIITASENAGILEYTRTIYQNSSTIQQKRYLAYSPVDKGGYIVLIIVPESEAIASVGPLKDRINSTTTTNIISVGVLILIAGIVSILFGVWISNRIARPIGRLTEIASKMATDSIREDIIGDFDVEIDQELESSSDEIGDLTRAFKGMIMALQENGDDQDEEPSFLGDLEEF